MDGSIVERMGGWLAGWMDGWMDGWTEEESVSGRMRDREIS